MPGYDYRLTVNLSSRSTGEADPQTIFPGVLVPPSLCQVVAAAQSGVTVRTDEELSKMSASARRDAATAKVKAWAEAQATAQMKNMNPPYTPFQVQAAEDPLIAQSDYQYWITADKFIWLPYGEEMGSTLQIYVATKSGQDAALRYPPVSTTNGVQTAWFLHCRLTPLGPAQG